MNAKFCFTPGPDSLRACLLCVILYTSVRENDTFLGYCLRIRRFFCDTIPCKLKYCICGNFELNVGLHILNNCLSQWLSCGTCNVFQIIVIDNILIIQGVLLLYPYTYTRYLYICILKVNIIMFEHFYSFIHIHSGLLVYTRVNALSPCGCLVFQVLLSMQLDLFKHIICFCYPELVCWFQSSCLLLLPISALLSAN